MKTIKVIDLLNKIANGEEVPRKFTYKNYLWEYDVKNKMWFYYFGESKSHRFDRLFYLNMILNDEVEILEEEKKIPEIIDVISWDSCIHGVTRKEKELAIEINKTQKLLNQLIDYLKSKGDE